MLTVNCVLNNTFKLKMATFEERLGCQQGRSVWSFEVRCSTEGDKLEVNALDLGSNPQPCLWTGLG